jgi:hypothetical protein
MKDIMKHKQEIWNFAVWFAIGWGLVNVCEWMIPSLASQTISAFFIGVFTMFVALSILGTWKQQQIVKQNNLAKQQWDIDRKADIEQQATIDQEIINKLKNDHSMLSGKEQNDRLEALEAALKHLRKQ